MSKKDKKVLMWVDPIFKSSLKVSAAKSNMSVINLTRKIAIDKRLLLEGEYNDEEIIRV